jgi:hypothetical protein
VSIATSALLFTLTRIIKVKFSRTPGKINQLNLKPLYLASVLLFLYIIDAVLQLVAYRFAAAGVQRFKDFVETLVLIVSCAVIGT